MSNVLKYLRDVTDPYWSEFMLFTLFAVSIFNLGVMIF